MPSIPSDFRDNIIERFIRAVHEAVRDFIQEDVPRLAGEQEDKLKAGITVAKGRGVDKLRKAGVADADILSRLETQPPLSAAPCDCRVTAAGCPPPYPPAEGARSWSPLLM